MELKPSEMVAENQKELHNGNADRLVLWYNQEQDYLEKLRDDWLFCIDLDNVISATEALGQDYDLPLDFDHFLAMVNTTDDENMEERTLAWLRRYDPDLSSDGSPDWYVMLGPTGTNNRQQVRLVDSPNADYTITFDYYKKLPLLNLVDDIPSLIPCSSLLMLRAEIRGRIDNEEAEDGPVVTYLEGRYQKLLRALLKHNTLRPNKNRRIRAHHLCTMTYWGRHGRGSGGL